VREDKLIVAQMAPAFTRSRGQVLCARIAYTRALSFGLVKATAVCAGILLAIATSAYPQTCIAQEAAQNIQPSTSADWVVTIGGWGNFAPKYEGSDEYVFGGTPIIDVHRLGSKEWLSLPKDGLDYELIETENFRAGPVADIRWGFGTVDERGLKEVGGTGLDLSIEVGAFAEYWPTDFWRTRLEARNAVYGAEGWVFDLSSDFVWRPDAAWTFAAGPRLSLADKAYMNAYYGIDGEQALSSHLPRYEAQGGFRSYGAGFFAQYKWNEQLTTMASVEYERLAGSADDTPLFSDNGSSDQFTFAIGAKYSFVWGR
jgi:outer membrane protein